MENRKGLVTHAALSFSVCVLYGLLLLTPLNGYVYTTLLKIALFLAVPLIFGKKKHTNVKGYFGTVKSKKMMALSFAVGAGVIIIILTGYFLLRQFFDDQMILGSLKNEGITKSNFPAVFLNIIFVNAFFEEFFFRGFVFRGGLKIGTKQYAYLFSAVLFALYHVTMIMNWFTLPIFFLCMAGLFVGGLIFNYVTDKCGSIFGSYIIHAAANLAINAIGLYIFMK